ncbi:polysaccharide biosynthesis tyrosine autokinase [soil metagenome]
MGYQNSADFQGPMHNTGFEKRFLATLNMFQDVLGRRYLTIVMVSLLVFGLLTVAIILTPRKYDAITRIQIDPSRNPLLDVRTTRENALGDEAIETEVGVLKSLDLARNVVRRLALQNDSEFTQGLADAGEARPISDASRVTAVAEALSRRLVVDRTTASYLLEVRFRSRNPVKAARIVNGFADVYLDTRVASRMRTSARQADWFRQRLADMSAQARDAEQRLADYRARAGLTMGAAGNSADQLVTPLSTELATAEAQAAAARSTLSAARSQIAGGSLDAVSAVRSSPVISDMRRQRAEIVQRMGVITARSGENHPETMTVRQQLASIDAQIRDEANRAIGSLTAEANSADAQVGSLRSAMNALESRQATNTRDSAAADGLARDAASKRTAYERIAQMSLESAQAARNSIAQAEIVDRAQPPRTPAWPDRHLFFLLAGIVSLGAGFAAATIQESMKPGFRSVDDIEKLLGISLLASVPRMNGKAGGSALSPADSLIRYPASMFAESLRNLQASVIVACPSADDCRVVAMTSAVPEEGKTTTALSFARVLAIGGAKTLLIDCDIRRASLRSLVYADRRAGLGDVLTGKATALQAIVPDDVGGLDLILVKTPDFSGSHLFGGDQMADLIDQFRDSYQFIVLDLPPLLGVADARFLSMQADATVLVVRWGSTLAPAVGSALSWLRADGANVIGAVYTMVDPRSEAIGGYYYSKKYSAYYHTA